jgi:hypothetical protein
MTEDPGFNEARIFLFNLRGLIKIIPFGNRGMERPCFTVGPDHLYADI